MKWKLQKSLLSLFIGKSPTDAPMWNNATPHKSKPSLWSKVNDSKESNASDQILKQPKRRVDLTVHIWTSKSQLYRYVLKYSIIVFTRGSRRRNGLSFQKSHHLLAEISAKSRKSLEKSLNYNPPIAILASILGYAINARNNQRIFKIPNNKYDVLDRYSYS
jgi:hypothetical protein